MADFDVDDFRRPDNVAPDDPVEDETSFWQQVRRQLFLKTVAALQTADNELGGATAAVDSVESQNLGQTAKEASDAVHRTFTDAEIDEIQGTMHNPPLNFRQLRGLDKAMQTICGEITNNLAILSSLDDHIALEKRKLSETVADFTRHRVASRTPCAPKSTGSEKLSIRSWPRTQRSPSVFADCACVWVVDGHDLVAAELNSGHRSLKFIINVCRAAGSGLLTMGCS